MLFLIFQVFVMSASTYDKWNLKNRKQLFVSQHFQCALAYPGMCPNVPHRTNKCK